MARGSGAEPADGATARERYRAFLSYSHTDSTVARRLHRRLETYRLPRHLAMTELEGAPPRRLGRIFRDREELIYTPCEPSPPSPIPRGASPVAAIAAGLPISGPAVSQHLKTLREAELVRVERRAQQRIYSLDPAGLDDIAQWIAQTRATWNARLDALEAAMADVDQEEKQR